MNVQMQSTNMDLTDELREFVEAKMDDVYRALGAMDRTPIQVDLELEKTTRRHPHEREDERRYRAEANLTVPGRLIRAEGSADDIHEAVTEMKHRLTREVREWRERLVDERRQGGRRAKQKLGAEPPKEEPAMAPQTEQDEARYAEEIEEFEGSRSEAEQAHRPKR